MKFRRNADGSLTQVSSVALPKYYGYTPDMTVKIQFGKIKCKFLTPYPQELDRALTAPHPGYIFTPQYKSGNWDGQHHFLTRAGYFPTGLLPVVFHILKTGINPLIKEDKKERKVLSKLPTEVKVIVPDKEKENFYPGIVTFYRDQINVVDYLNADESIFAYSLPLLHHWKKVEDKHVFAKSVLDLVKSLKIKDLS